MPIIPLLQVGASSEVNPKTLHLNHHLLHTLLKQFVSLISYPPVALPRSPYPWPLGFRVLGLGYRVQDLVGVTHNCIQLGLQENTLKSNPKTPSPVGMKMSVIGR